MELGGLQNGEPLVNLVLWMNMVHPQLIIDGALVRVASWVTFN
jgi:hypothetical protein